MEVWAIGAAGETAGGDRLCCEAGMTAGWDRLGIPGTAALAVGCEAGGRIWVSQSSADSGQPWLKTIGWPDPQRL